MDRNKMERWEKIRSQGKKRFILRNGVFGWGLGTGILFGILMVLKGAESLTLVKWILSVLLFMVFGYFWSKFMWNWMETKYRREQEKF